MIILNNKNRRSKIRENDFNGYVVINCITSIYGNETHEDLVSLKSYKTERMAIKKANEFLGV